MLIFTVFNMNSIYLHLQHDGTFQQNILVNSSLFLLYLADFERLMCTRKVLVKLECKWGTTLLLFKYTKPLQQLLKYLFSLPLKLAVLLDSVNTGLKLWLNAYLLILSYIWVSWHQSCLFRNFKTVSIVNSMEQEHGSSNMFIQHITWQCPNCNYRLDIIVI